MSYSTGVPNAAQSPGLFPLQNNTNFIRLKRLIGQDHVFNNSQQTTDGRHKQCTFISRANPNALPAGTNSMLYSWIDENNRSQLKFYNGAETYQITPLPDEFPIRFVASQNINAGQQIVMYPDPGFEWCGTAWALYQGTNTYTCSNIIRSGDNFQFVINANGSTSSGNATSRPTMTFNGNNLRFRNDSNINRICTLSLIINKIS